MKRESKMIALLGCSFFILTGFGQCNPEPDKLPLAQTCVSKSTDLVAYFNEFSETVEDHDTGCASVGSVVTDGTYDPDSLLLNPEDPFSYYVRASALDSNNNSVNPSSLDLLGLNYPAARDGYTMQVNARNSFLVPANLPGDVIDGDKVVNFRMNFSSPDFPESAGLVRNFSASLWDQNNAQVANLTQRLQQTANPHAGTISLTLKVGRVYTIVSDSYVEFLTLGPADENGTEPVLIQSFKVHPWVSKVAPPVAAPSF